MWRRCAAVAALALQGLTVCALTIEADGVESAVTVLTDANFEELVNGGKDTPWFVEFYAPWCGHCQSLAPEWERLPALLGDNVRVGKVDGTEEKRLATEFEIDGFPVLKLIASGKMYAYQGAREADAMAEWAGGGYVNDNSERLPAEKTQLDKLQKKTKEVVGAIGQVFSHLPALLPLTLGIGFWVGFLSLYVFGLLLRPSLKTGELLYVKVVRDEKTGTGLTIDPLTMNILKVTPERKDLQTIQAGDKIIAINKKSVLDSDDYRELTHKAKEFTVTICRQANGKKNQ